MRISWQPCILPLLTDPGLSMQRAGIMKITAQTRAELIKALKDDNEDHGEDLTAMAKQAVREFKEAALCLKCPKKCIKVCSS